jgi:hypothetical protein
MDRGVSAHAPTFWLSRGTRSPIQCYPFYGHKKGESCDPPSQYSLVGLPVRVLYSLGLLRRHAYDHNYRRRALSQTGSQGVPVGNVVRI